MRHKAGTSPKSRRHKVTVLLSGGIDSATAIELLKARKNEMRALFIDYGQSALRYERKAARAVSKHYGLPLSEVSISGVFPKRDGEIAGRNAALISIALLESSRNEREIVVGVHGGTQYADCGPLFIEAMQRVADISTGGRIQIVAPFLRWKKPAIVAFAKTAKVPIALTYSCEMGKSRLGCGRCKSCMDRREINARA